MTISKKTSAAPYQPIKKGYFSIFSDSPTFKKA